jgi:hypothetical protein
MCTAVQGRVLRLSQGLLDALERWGEGTAREEERALARQLFDDFSKWGGQLARAGGWGGPWGIGGGVRDGSWAGRQMPRDLSKGFRARV